MKLAYMKSKKYLNDLSHRITGKIVWAVEPPSPIDTECLCRIITADGKSFRIHATDLGAWIEDDVDVDGLYPTLESVCIAVGAYRNAKLPEHGFTIGLPIVRVEGRTLIINAFDGSIFKLSLDRTDGWEKKVFSHQKILEIIPVITASGEYWRLWFDVKQKRAENHFAGGDLSIIPDELLREFPD
jgi:hypothetical protein